jgi:hypothetical protein
VSNPFLMARLNSSQRNALPSSAFALPSERKYPVEDAAHRANAKSRAAGQANKGKISRSTEKKIDVKAGGLRGALNDAQGWRK